MTTPNATTGTAWQFQIMPEDGGGTQYESYNGTTIFSTTDTDAVVPGPSTFTSGRGTFSATFYTSGSQTLSAVDSQNANVTGTITTTVIAASTVATHFVFVVPTTVAGNTRFGVTVTALDAGNNVATDYPGVVNFTTSDPVGGTPNKSTLTSGTGIFSFTLETTGSQTLTANDNVLHLTGTSSGITVSSAGITHFVVTGPANVTSGVGFAFTVTAEDQNNSTYTSYTGTVGFTSNDHATNVVLPANSTLTNGVGTFSATLITVASKKISATDSVNPRLTGNVTVAVN